MSWTLVNTAHKNTNTSTLTVPATTVGNLLVIAASFDAGGSALAPSGGGTWTRIGTLQHDATDTQDATWFYCVCTTSVTSISGMPSSAVGAAYAEFAPPAGTVALDVQDTTKAFFSSSTTADANTSNSVTPAAANELVLSAIYDQSGSAPTFTAGTGFTLAVQEPGVSGVTGAVAIEYIAAGPSGAQNAKWTMNKAGNTIAVQIAVFKPAAASGTGWTQNVDDSVTMSDAQTFGRGLTIAESLTLADALAMDRGLSIADSATLADAVAFGYGLALADSVTMSDSANPVLSSGQNWTQNIDDAVTLADAVAFGYGLGLTDAAALADALAFDRGLLVADAVTLADAQAFAYGLSLADTVTLADALAKGQGLGLADIVSIADGIASDRALTLNDAVTLSDALSMLFNGQPLGAAQAAHVRSYFVTKFGFYT